MPPRNRVATASLLGTLLTAATPSAFAQSAAPSASPAADATPTPGTARSEGTTPAEAPACPPGCVPATSPHAARHRAPPPHAAAETTLPAVTPPATPTTPAPPSVPTPQPAARPLVAEARIPNPTAPHPPAPQRPRGGGPFGAGVPAIQPLVSFALEGGFGGFSTGVGHVTYIGPTWGARVGVSLVPFFMIEGRYFGALNGTRDVIIGPGVDLLTSGGSAVARFTVPLPWVQPYLFGGVGFYYTSLVGNGIHAQNILHSAPAVGVPLGIGIEVPINRHWSLAAEGTYHGQFAGDFSNVRDFEGRQLFTGSGLVRFTL